MKTALSGNSSPIYARTERGYSLAEILVVLAVFAVLIVAALMVYDQSNKVFKQSVESSDMQQSTRVAFDKLVSELRLAGFDFDRDGIPFGSLAGDWKASSAYTLGALVQPSPPNGHVYICIGGGTSGAAAPAWPTASKTDIDDGSVKWEEDGNVQYQQPDEQIEYAGNSAITFRGNFNYETYTAPCPDDGSGKICENGREAWLESAEFPLVTTSNSEIVTYALVSNSGNASANKDTVDFYADIDKPRDVSPKTGNKEAAVSITGIDLSNKYPPYTLYRYTLDDNGKAVGVPIADNIRSLTFRYFADTAATTKQEIGCGDAAVCTVADLPFGKGQFDGNKPDVDIIERDVRQKIKSVRLALVGMNPQQDASFNDTSDAYAPNYRKFPLETVVVPRNLGKHGLKEFNTTLPEPPELKSVCIGACNAAFLTWAAPKSGGDIDSYNVVYSPGDCSSPKLTYGDSRRSGNSGIIPSLVSILS